MTHPLVAESQNVWLDKWRYDEAETNYHIVKLGGSVPCTQQHQQPQAPQQQSALVSEIAKARQHIQKSLKSDIHGSGPVDNNILVSRLESLELDNKGFRQVTADLQAVVKKLESRIAALECAGGKAPSAKEEKPVSKQEEGGDDDDDDDDDIDLFGSDEEDEEEAARIKEERVKEYEARKSKKTAIIAKSNVIMDVKPWDDETDMAVVEKCVRSIKMDGLLWGTSKLVPVGYGIKKLTISTVIEDDKVSMVDLEDKILEFEEYIQSMDVAAFNKL